MKRILAKNQKEILLVTIKTCVLNTRPEVITVYIYGSFLSAETFSDIDVGVLAKEESARPMMYEFELETALQKLIHVPVDVRLLNRAPVSFCRNVIRNGEVILDLEPTFRADFENLTLKKYFDFSTFRRRYLEDVFDAPL